jgi:hypothetical protein
VANHVVAGLEVLRDGSRSGEAVLDEVVCRPGTGAARGDQAGLRYLRPLQRRGAQ